MHRLIYISTALPEVDEAALGRILVQSRERNADAGVTGLLIFDGKRFFQYLEGAACDVEATLDRIRRDPRHRALVVLSRGECARRQFPRWAMAGRSVEQGRLVNTVEELAAGCDPEIARELVGFASVRAAA